MAISNVVCPVGIAQQAVATAIEEGDAGIAACSAVWRERHDLILNSLSPRFEVVPAHGGWSMLVDCSALGLTGAQASQRLLQHGVAATSMENWGTPDTAKYLRMVFANEPVERLRRTAERFEAAFGG